MKETILAAVCVAFLATGCYAQQGKKEIDPAPRQGVPDEYSWVFGDKAKALKDTEEAELREKELVERKAKEAREAKEKADAAEAFAARSKGSGELQTAAVKTLRDPSENTWDFGQVKEGDVLVHEFSFQNTGMKVLNIGQVHTSCGCTVSEVSKRVLQPGEAAAIKVKVDTKGDSGAMKQQIYVNTDDADDPVTVFIVKAEVNK